MADAFAGEAIFDGTFDAGFDGCFDAGFDGVLDLDGAFFWGDVTWLPALLLLADCPQEKSSPPTQDCERENLSQKKSLQQGFSKFSFKSLQQRYTGRGRKLGLTCLVSLFVASFDSSSSSRRFDCGLWRSAGSGRPAVRLRAFPACLSVLSAAAPAATIRWPRVMSVCLAGGGKGWRRERRGFVFEYELYSNMHF